MNSAEANFWGIHAGKTGDADTLFLKKNCIALGWAKAGNLSDLASDREAFKLRLQQSYPDKKPGAIPVDAGQLFRFLNEMKKGDWVVYPSKGDRLIHLGQVQGPYAYDPASEESYPNRRPVKWLKAIPRTKFSQGALHEIGSAMSLFLVKNYLEEFRQVLAGETPAVASPVQDESVAAVTEDIEETTRDFVLKKLARELKGIGFEGFVIHLLECMGYHARQTRVNEPSVDIIAHKDHLGVEKPVIKVQVKSGEGVTTDKDVSALSGKLTADQLGLFITLGTFSPKARDHEQSKGNVRLIDGHELVGLIFEHYERFDSRHKSLLPLRRVYVPETIDTDAE